VGSSHNIVPADFAAPLADLGLDPASFDVVDPAPPPPSEHRPLPVPRRGNLLYGRIGERLDVARACATYRARGDGSLPPDGWALFFLKDQRGDGELARWRESLWPWLHVVAIYRCADGRATRATLHGSEAVAGAVEPSGVLIAARRREHVLSPDATVAKFADTAAGWDMDRSKPGYAHFRWMRRFVARLAEPRRGAKILDFGCGAGWIGIEAARAAGEANLRAFDPSPAMVERCEKNARESGVRDFEARVGFGERPPYPAAGEPRFDVVLSSGVASFAPDRERWFDGLVSTVAPGGRLVLADLNRESRGMRRRRETKPLLPVREMNALSEREARALLEARGFAIERTALHQLSYPVPELAHALDSRGLGALSRPLVWLNALAAGRSANERAFDSFALVARAPV
jgi:2-polyprenyl-3-methyl-5-hydroxy-6-metoxy-1,4-benzoquinol methylase